MAGAAHPPASDAVAQSARLGEPDRYLAALLARPDARPHLLALAAFASEIARVSSAVVREPAMGEIRLQWWRDALEAPAPGLTGNPVADAVRHTVLACGLPRLLLLDVIDAHAVEMAAEPLADDAALATYLWKTEGVLFALAARILGVGPASNLDAIAAAAGHAYGLARLLLGVPHALSHGRVLLPQSLLAGAGISSGELLAGEGADRFAVVLDALDAQARNSLATARQLVANMPREIRVAFLPLALVGPYLRALRRPGRDLVRTAAEIAPLTRVWRIAAAHWLGRI